MGVIYFNGVSSRSVGLVVENPPVYKTPEREYESYHVPGRNGDLLLDLGSFKNVTRSYDVAFGSFYKTHAEMASAVSAWLYSPRGEESPDYPVGEGFTSAYEGYFRLEDSYEPEYYRLARCINEIEFENTLNRLGRATIEFDCMPQRFLKSGDKPFIFDNESSSLSNKTVSIYNPTLFIAKPRINFTIEGDSTLVNSTLLQFSSQDKYNNNLNIVIYRPTASVGSFVGQLDSELEEFYSAVLTADWRRDNKHRFPIFRPGKTEIYIDDSMARMEIIPRWWTI